MQRRKRLQDLPEVRLSMPGEDDVQGIGARQQAHTQTGAQELGRKRSGEEHHRLFG